MNVIVPFEWQLVLYVLLHLVEEDVVRRYEDHFCIMSLAGIRNTSSAFNVRGPDEDECCTIHVPVLRVSSTRISLCGFLFWSIGSRYRVDRVWIGWSVVKEDER